MDDIKLALLGNKEAAKRLADAGVLVPCAMRKVEYLQNKQDFEVYKADVLHWDMAKREKALRCRECVYRKKIHGRGGPAMSMTQEQALKLLEHPIYKWSMDWDEREDGLNYTEAIEIAIAALRHQIWKKQLWHDAKTDPPKTPGLYYGKKDDTNSMYACQYRDGVWVLDMYPQQKMDIMQWADYTAFAREGE